MPYALIVDVIPEGGGRVSVGHVFYGETETEARENFAAHAKGCQFLTPAIEQDRVNETVEEIDDLEWPEYDEEGDPVESDDDPDPERE